MPNRLSDMIYQAIRSDLESGALGKNTFFSEAEIAARFNVSKAPVKSALKQLCNQH